MCQSEVFYAAGAFQSPHFRHRPGSDDDECERRANNFHRDVPLSQHEYEHLDAVLVATQSPHAQETSVAFAVRFRPAYQAGFVHFIAGESSVPYTIHPNLRQQYFQITTAEKNYLVKAHLNGRQHELHIVEGFEEEPAVFRASDREAVRIPKHRILKPGAYIVVSRKVISNFHPLVQPKSIKTIRGVYATLIQIPEDPSWQVRQNLQAILHFEIAAKIADYGFFAPFSAYELAPDCWEISKDAEVAIRIRVSRNLVPRYTQLLVQERRSGHLTTNYLSLKDDADTFTIQSPTGKLRPDIIRVGLAHPVRFLFEIRFSNDCALPQSANIVFKFGKSPDTRMRLTWTAHELASTLINASRGNGELLSVVFPKAIQLSISDRGGRRLKITQDDTARQIVSFLRSGKFPCCLSALGYPDVVLKRQRTVRQRPFITKQSTNVKPRSHYQARLLNAFNRGRVSAYSIRSIAYE